MSRENKKGGGVGLYVKNNINYKTRHDVINNSSSNLELFGIEIINNTPTKNTIIIVIYRSPKCQVNKFIEILEEILIAIHKENKSYIIMGDFNIDCMPQNDENDKLKFIQLMMSYGYTQIISHPTRISPVKQSLIDNFFINTTNKIDLSGVVSCDISDHLPIFLQLQLHSKNNIQNITAQPINTFSFSTKRLDNLNNLLIMQNWEKVYKDIDTDGAFEEFIKNYQFCFYECCEIKSKN